MGILPKKHLSSSSNFKTKQEQEVAVEVSCSYLLSYLVVVLLWKQMHNVVQTQTNSLKLHQSIVDTLKQIRTWHNLLITQKSMCKKKKKKFLLYLSLKKKIFALFSLVVCYLQPFSRGYKTTPVYHAHHWLYGTSYLLTHSVQIISSLILSDCCTATLLLLCYCHSVARAHRQPPTPHLPSTTTLSRRDFG